MNYTKLEEIKNGVKIDSLLIESINNSDDERLLQFDVNPLLLEEVIKEMPQNMTLVEKTMYVYLKMCTILTYDESYYASMQSDEETLKHNNIKNLSNITPTNNRVICYEFNMIFSKILNLLGCKFRIKTDDNNSYFGYGHTSLIYCCDDIIISADSITSILYGDLQLVKRGQNPIGLLCENKDISKNDDFNYYLEEMVDLVKDQMKKGNFIDILDEYRKLNIDTKDFSVTEKIEMLLSLLSKSNLTGIDAIGYSISLSRQLFWNSKNMIDMAVVNEKVDDIYKATVVFTINKKNIDIVNDNLYILFNPPKTFRKCNYNELLNMFNNTLTLHGRTIKGIEDSNDRETKNKK